LSYLKGKAPASGGISAAPAAVGLFLFHRYSLPALSASVLKGADRAVYDALDAEEGRGRRFHVSFCGVIVTAKSWDGFNYEYKTHEITMQDVLSGKAKDASKKKREAGVDLTKIFVVCDRDTPKGFRELIHDHYIEYTGNGSSPAYHAYYHACMIVKPAPKASAGVAAGAEKKKKSATESG